MGQFGFAEFNRAFIEDGPGDGFSMLVLDSQNSKADCAEYAKAGLQTYDQFDFSRKATLPSGEEVTVSFSLAFVTHPDMPSTAFFTCQQHAPEYFWKSEFQSHQNTANGIVEVILLADRPLQYSEFLQNFAGGNELSAGDELVSIKTSRGTITAMSLNEWSKHYPASFAPDLAGGPRLAAYRLKASDLEAVEECFNNNAIPHFHDGQHLVISPEEAFGTAIIFNT